MKKPRQLLAAVRAAATELGREVLEGSVIRGLRDGLVAASPVVTDTEHPAAALYFLSTLSRQMVAVMLDLAGHLKEERTMRALREVVETFAKNGSTLVLVDQAAELPAAVRAMSTPLDLSLPDEAALTKIISETVHTCGAAKPVKVNLSRAEFAMMVRNSPRVSAARQAHAAGGGDAVCDDFQLDAQDLNTILAEKRRLVSGEGLLQYVQAPVEMDEIGGMRRLKFWLEQRKEAADR